jgi:hypothetical protein
MSQVRLLGGTRRGNAEVGQIYGGVTSQFSTIFVLTGFFVGLRPFGDRAHFNDLSP